MINRRKLHNKICRLFVNNCDDYFCDYEFLSKKQLKLIYFKLKQLERTLWNRKLDVYNDYCKIHTILDEVY